MIYKKILLYGMLFAIMLFSGCQSPQEEVPVLVSGTPILSVTASLEYPISSVSPTLEETELLTPTCSVIVPSVTPAISSSDVEHIHQFEENTCILCQRTLSMLRTTAHENTYVSGFLGSTNINKNLVRTRILRIIFCDYEDTEGHYFSDLNCWDVSRMQDGSIMAWYVDHSPNQYYDIYIAPTKENIIIQAHTDASYLFANLENQVSMTAEIRGLEKVEFGQTTNMSYLFAGTRLAPDFVFNVDTTNVTNVSYMYQADLNAPIEGGIQFGEQVDFSNVTEATGMFLNQSEIKELTLPDSLKMIAPYMFYSCSKLRTVNIPDGVTDIGTGAFQFCTRLSYVNLPETVTHIGSQAFYQCERLLSFTIPAQLEEMGDAVFKQCNKLSSISWQGTTYTDVKSLYAAMQEQNILKK